MSGPARTGELMSSRRRVRQIANSEHVGTERFIDPTEFRNRVEAASSVISHAGTGAIVTT